MLETAEIHRYNFSLGDSKIDLGASTIRQVSLITEGEARGHTTGKEHGFLPVMVDQTTLSQVYECLTELGSLKVKADHGSGVFSTAGWVDNFERGDDKVFGDLHIYDAEPEKERLFEIAKKNPTHLGLSLEFEGLDQIVPKQKALARCDSVSAVALVSDPAANKSLFEKNKNSVDESQQNVNKARMATKKLDDKPEIKPEEKKEMDSMPGEMPSNDYESRFAALEARMNKYDEGAVNKEDANKPALPAINPNAEPKANNNGPTLANGEKGEVKGDEPAANPPGVWEEEEKKFEARLARASELGAEKAIRTFAAKLGIKSLPASPAPFDAAKPTAKEFSVLVAEKEAELSTSGDKNAKTNAMLFCIKNHKAEYAASRNVRTL